MQTVNNTIGGNPHRVKQMFNIKMYLIKQKNITFIKDLGEFIRHR